MTRPQAEQHLPFYSLARAGNWRVAMPTDRTAWLLDYMGHKGRWTTVASGNDLANLQILWQRLTGRNLALGEPVVGRPNA